MVLKKHIQNPELDLSRLWCVKQLYLLISAIRKPIFFKKLPKFGMKNDLK